MRTGTLYAILSGLGLLAAINGLLIFGDPHWFSPFAGVLLNAAFPFAGAMAVSAYYDINGAKP